MYVHDLRSLYISHLSWLISFINRFDHNDQGFVTVDDFTQVLNSRDLGLQLNENELVYVAEQSNVYGNGWVPFVQVVTRLPDILLAIYKQRAEGAVVSVNNCPLTYCV